MKLFRLLAVLMSLGLIVACGAPEDVVVEPDAPAAAVDAPAAAADDLAEDELIAQDEIFAADIGAVAVATGDYDPFRTFDSFQESPFLAGRDLPPVEERLPLFPKVPNTLPPHQVAQSIGRFGGELRTATPNAVWNPNIWAMSNEPLLNTPGILGEEITGNVLHWFEVCDDYMEFTFHMREGMRWSDGEFVTVEDVRFVFESIYSNPALYPIFPAWLSSPTGNPPEFTILSNYSFRFNFDAPYGGLLMRLAIRQWTGYSDLIRPAHFLRNFHINYTDEATILANAAARGEEADDWIIAFLSVQAISWDINEPFAVDYPTLRPWLNMGTANQITRFERNPFYWKVDAEGNQLPYIDTKTSMHLQSTEQVTMMIIAGEVDFNVFETSLVNMPLYLQHAEENGYQVIMSEWHVTPTDIYLNLAYPDEQWREIALDRRFRLAMNYAFNNAEVINAVYGGFASPSRIINPEFNPERANELLDEMGMDFGTDGFRTFPNGDPFFIQLDFADRTPDMRIVGEYFVSFMGDVGIRVNMRMPELSLHTERIQANEVQATIIWTEIIWYNVGEWVFMDGMATAYWQYFSSGGAVGIEPPPDILALFNYITNAMVLSPDEALAEFDRYLESWRHNVWGLQFLHSVQQPVIANENLRNVQITQPTWGIGLAFGGEIFYFE